MISLLQEISKLTNKQKPWNSQKQKKDQSQPKVGVAQKGESGQKVQTSSYIESLCCTPQINVLHMITTPFFKKQSNKSIMSLNVKLHDLLKMQMRSSINLKCLRMLWTWDSVLVKGMDQKQQTGLKSDLLER